MHFSVLSKPQFESNIAQKWYSMGMQNACPNTIIHRISVIYDYLLLFFKLSAQIDMC